MPRKKEVKPPSPVPLTEEEKMAEMRFEHGWSIKKISNTWRIPTSEVKLILERQKRHREIVARGEIDAEWELRKALTVLEEALDQKRKTQDWDGVIKAAKELVNAVKTVLDSKAPQSLQLVDARSVHFHFSVDDVMTEFIQTTLPFVPEEVRKKWERALLAKAEKFQGGQKP